MSVTAAFGAADALAALALALVLDAAVGEMPTRAHPVAWFGAAVAAFDRPWARPRLAGVGIALALPSAAALVVTGVVASAGAIHPWLTAVAAGVALFVATSLRMLWREALSVIGATAADLGAARTRLRSLAGRDADDLSAGEVRSAAVESAAENLADGLVAPLCAFAVGAAVSVPVAAGAAAWVKGVNTLDSMLGYPDERVGTASARLDDAVMWLPARLSSALIALASLDPRAVARARRHADRPPSPNSGWPMATLAAVLGVRLAKPGRYELPYGDAFPGVPESRRAISTVGVAGLLAYALAGAGVVAWS